MVVSEGRGDAEGQGNHSHAGGAEIGISPGYVKFGRGLRGLRCLKPDTGAKV